MISANGWRRLLAGTAGLLLAAAGLRAGPPVIRITNSVFEPGGSFRLGWSVSRPDMSYAVETRTPEPGSAWGPISEIPGVGGPISETTYRVPVAFMPVNALYRVRGIPFPSERGKVLSSTRVRTFSAFEVQLILGFLGINQITARNGVQFHKVVYETVDPHGFRTQASGAIAVPDGVTGPFPVLSYQHGTVTAREDVPSRVNTEGYLGAILASQGYLTLLPDYLGLGDSPGVHPYHHAASEASATIDLLRAGRAWTATNHVATSGKLFLAGYSQGGHATLAAMKEIEANLSAEFPLTAVAAGAGAYDLAGVTLEALLSGNPSPNPYYFPYLLASYIEVYGLAPSLADVLAAPYSTTVPPLFASGLATSAALNAALPAVPIQAMKPEGLAAFRTQPDHPLREALRRNSLIDWVPQAPLRLYHCAADQDVPPANSDVALERFTALGAPSVGRFDPMPTASHGDCAAPAVLLATLWFETLR